VKVYDMTEQKLNEAIIEIKNRCDGRMLTSLENRKFTTNIADAWVLVEEMAKGNDVVDVKVWCDCGQWFCEVNEERGEWYRSTRRHIEHNDPSSTIAIAKCYYEWRIYDRTS
jgi:hypothetical protein